eukprot:symbB.v1.2.035287.t2/scaffold4713.1/size41565/1
MFGRAAVPGRIPDLDSEHQPAMIRADNQGTILQAFDLVRKGKRGEAYNIGAEAGITKSVLEAKLDIFLKSMLAVCCPRSALGRPYVSPMLALCSPMLAVCGP